MQQYPPNEQPSYPYPQQPPQFTQPPAPAPKPRRRLPRGCVIALVVVAVLLVFGVVMAITTGGNGVGNATSTPTAPAQSQATSVPTAKPTSAPKGDPAHALLGGTVDDFIAKYGKLNSHSDPSKGNYNFSLYGNDKNDLTVTTLYNTHIDAILYSAPEPKMWNATEAKSACLGLLPHDATYKRKMTIYDPQGKPMDEQYVYVVPSIGKLFPASVFTDEKGNPATPGTIGLILSHWTATSYVQCTLQVGLESK